AAVVDGEACVPGGELNVLGREEGRGLQSVRALRAEVGDPAVPRTAQRRRQGRVEAVDVDRLSRPGAEQDADVDALGIHGFEHGLGWRATAQALPLGALYAHRPGALSLGPVHVRREA